MGNQMKYPCYTTRTGIKIGCAYQPPLRQLSLEESRIQSALLSSKSRHVSLKTVALICLGLWFCIIWIAK